MEVFRTKIEKSYLIRTFRGLSFAVICGATIISPTKDSIAKIINKECISGQCVDGEGTKRYVTNKGDIYELKSKWDNQGKAHDCETTLRKNDILSYKGPYWHGKQDTRDCPNPGITHYSDGSIYKGGRRKGKKHGTGWHYLSPNDTLPAHQRWDMGEYKGLIPDPKPTRRSSSPRSSSCSVQDISPSSGGKCGTCAGGSYPGETVCATYYSGGWNTVGGYGGHATDYWEALNNACCRR